MGSAGHSRHRLSNKFTHIVMLESFPSMEPASAWYPDIMGVRKWSLKESWGKRSLVRSGNNSEPGMKPSGQEWGGQVSPWLGTEISSPGRTPKGLGGGGIQKPVTPRYTTTVE